MPNNKFYWIKYFSLAHNTSQKGFTHKVFITKNNILRNWNKKPSGADLRTRIPSTVYIDGTFWILRVLRTFSIYGLNQLNFEKKLTLAFKIRYFDTFDWEIKSFLLGEQELCCGKSRAFHRECKSFLAHDSPLNVSFILVNLLHTLYQMGWFQSPRHVFSSILIGIGV